MKILLVSIMLSILSAMNSTTNSVSINGNIDPLPGQSVTMTVSPDDASYTYVWDCEGNWESQERRFDFSYSGNQITITPKEMKVQMLGLHCTVYDENGNTVGGDYVEIIWYWRN
ncbi:hypothetical protein [Bacteroides muris (ex Fokt et al. 2023)]|uniref:Ig-like domain-containing protein n=1 Tax=Bacteroides muris (ex Fokt et al. 2023) TaxID=2937417 RepID=A0A9X2NR93_9BACE|nr:hypothetical protein [Bacteroides muris (ex Fokt et al. 2023)]MCR6503739.1 hypothetical protein [Bacteroides muris (ex Fokt et al. 2023)]